MADIILFFIVAIVPSVLALTAIDALAGWYPSFRSNDHMTVAVGMFEDQPNVKPVWHAGSEHAEPSIADVPNPGWARPDTSNEGGGGMPNEAPVAPRLSMSRGESTV